MGWYTARLGLSRAEARDPVLTKLRGTRLFSHPRSPIRSRTMRPLLPLLAALAVTTPVSAQSRITPGQNVSSRIDSGDPIYRDGTPYEAYRFTARAGATYTITMRSGDFDSYLILFEGTDLSGTSTATNDDGGGGLNAQITHTTTRGGTWTILANTISASARGSFTLD